ncbi:unnamed protein product, partial [Vitis vinifera]
MKKLRWARPKKVAHNENAVVYCGPKRSDESNPDKGDFAFPSLKPSNLRFFDRWVDLGLAQLIHFGGLIGGLAAETGFHLWVLFEMVYFHSSISVCNSVDQSGIMASSLNSGEACSKSRQNNHACRNRKTPNSPNSAKIPDCSRSRSAMIDLVMLIAVVGACGFLLFPYVKVVANEFKGLFELPRDHHRELEAELKKMAPPNGRAVLVFRARCGCSVGRMEVPGPKKLRKFKK